MWQWGLSIAERFICHRKIYCKFWNYCVHLLLRSSKIFRLRFLLLRSMKSSSTNGYLWFRNARFNYCDFTTVAFFTIISEFDRVVNICRATDHQRPVITVKCVWMLSLTSKKRTSSTHETQCRVFDSFCTTSKELLTVPEHMSSPTVFSGVRIARSLVVCVMLYRSLFVLLSFFFFRPFCLPFWYRQTLLRKY